MCSILTTLLCLVGVVGAGIGERARKAGREVECARIGEREERVVWNVEWRDGDEKSLGDFGPKGQEQEEEAR